MDKAEKFKKAAPLGSFFEQLTERLKKGLPVSTPQSTPDMLLVGCVDARLDPNDDLGIPPNKALIYRNIAAMIFGNKDGQHLGEQASLEYAVKVKKVKDIVVMGHTHCGGIGACVCGTPHQHIREYFPKDWMAKSTQPADEAKARKMEKAAVQHSIDQLMTYDFVKKAVEDGELTLHGWVIDTANKTISQVVRQGRAEKNNPRIDHILTYKTRHPSPDIDLTHKPQVLIIGGIDERVTAHDLRIHHGEALIYRCPSAFLPQGDKSAAAIIEFATKAMNIKEIIVVGHRDSGGVRVKQDPKRADDNAGIRNYLGPLDAATPEDMEEQAVQKSIANIKSYVGDETLKNLSIHGMIIEPQTKAVEIFDDHTHKFTALKPTPPTSRRQ